MKFIKCSQIALGLLIFTSGAHAATEEVNEETVVRVGDSSLPALALDLPVGATLRLADLALDAARPRVTLELERFRVFAPQARVIVDRGTTAERVLPAPANAYYRGSLAGEPGSLVLLTVREAGGMRGLVTKDGAFWVMEAVAEAGGNIAARRIDLQAEFGDRSANFSCGTDHLPVAADLITTTIDPQAAQRRIAAAPTASYTAKVGIDTDFEYFQRFGNTTDATDYAGDLIAYSSTIYDAEVDTSMLIETLFLYTSSADPWVQFGATCGLMEFGRYWNDNNGGVERTIAHFLSGKNNGGGVAWVGVLCSAAFDFTLSTAGINCAGMPDTDNYGGAYGYSGDLDANFDINNPSVVWDIVVVSHEIGHNFNSPHSHCYGGLGGAAAPVDECNAGQCGGAGCHCGPTSLPGPPGSGTGTIMSYCHLLGPGISNIGLTFGVGHPFGVQPERVASRMSDHVVATAGANPACLALTVPDLIFDDSFESGDTNAWSQ